MTTTLDLKLGRNDSDSAALKAAFQLEAFFDVPKLALHIPTTFDREQVLPASALGMAGNDEFGDCVPAEAQHSHLLSAASVGVTEVFSTEAALKDYAEVNGHGYPITAGGPDDQGTDMLTMAKYRVHTGIQDAAGKRHKDDAYFNVEPANLQTLLVVAYVCRSASVGVDFPGSAMTQFNAGKPWTVVKGSTIDGGHCIGAIGHKSKLELTTWGAYQGMTAPWYEKYGTECIAYVDLDAINKLNGKTADLIDIAGINAAVASVKKA
jgi:hypothetical protein